MNAKIVIPLVLLLASCREPPQSSSLSAEEKTKIAEEVQAAVEDYFEAFKSRDADGLLSFWADDEGFAMASDGSIISGYDVWTSGMQERLESLTTVNYVELSNPHVYVLAEDAASYMMEFRWSRTSSEGETVKASGSWVYVMKRYPEGWKAVHSGGTHIFS